MLYQLFVTFCLGILATIFGAIFAFREGVGIGCMSEGGENNWSFEVPLQFGLSFALNKYRNYVFTVLGGGYLRLFFPDYDGDYGLCSLLQLDLNKCILGFELNKSTFYGISYGINVGFKLK